MPHAHVITRASGAVKGKVGIVTGGGSGHLPVFAGYVGKGLLDGAAIGDVFASPSADEMAQAMQAVNGGAGVLRLYGNYGGDVMNFDMAGENGRYGRRYFVDNCGIGRRCRLGATGRGQQTTWRRRHGIRFKIAVPKRRQKRVLMR